MAITVWSDQKVSLTIGNKATNMSGISLVSIEGDNTNIICGDTITAETKGTEGISSTTDSGSLTNYTSTTADSVVKFYVSPKSTTATSATGTISVTLLWRGPDKKVGTSDDSLSDTHTITGVTVRNAIDSILPTNSGGTLTTSYTMNLGETLTIYYQARGEYHSSYSKYLPVYTNSTKMTVEKLNSSGTYTSVSNSTTTSTGTTGSFTFTPTDIGTYRLRIASYNASSLAVYSSYITVTVKMAVTNTMYFSATAASTVGYTKYGTPSLTLKYSTDRTSWTTWDGSSVSLAASSTLYVIGDNNGSLNGSSNYITFTGSGKMNIGGKITALMNYKSDVTPPAYACMYLFRNNKAIISASSLTIPSGTANTGTYESMFYGCTALTTAPSLPATTLSYNAYGLMFQGCTSLTTAPSLPATALSSYCYQYMFLGCTSLLQSPILSATTTPTHCYYSMFDNCTALTTVNTISATALSSYCCASMFGNCTKLTTVPTSLPATTLASYCYSSMFYNCTSLTTAPVLPATALVSYCYTTMFNKCSNLKFVNAQFTTTPGQGYTDNWLANVATNGLFIKNPSATWDVRDVSGIPTTWKVPLTFYANAASTVSYTDGNSYKIKLYYSTNPTSLNAFTLNTGTLSSKSISTGSALYIYGDNSTGNDTSAALKNYFSVTGNVKLLGDISSFISISADNYSLSGINYAFQKLFYNCSGLTNILYLLLSATTLSISCYQNMFYGCTGITTAPALPATTLTVGCYNSMFYGCSKLTEAPALSAKTLTAQCYRSMFYGCTKLGALPVISATTLATSCCNSMFYGCTSLNNAPVLYATTLVSDCYGYMFYGCTNLEFINAKFTTTPSSTYTASWLYNVADYGLFIKNPSATWDVRDVSGIPTNWKVPLTFYANSASTVGYTDGKSAGIYLYYSTNPTSYYEFTGSSGTLAALSISAGSALYIYGSNPTGNLNTSAGNVNYFTVTGNVTLSGDINSFLDVDASTTSLSDSTYTFKGLFYNCTGLTNAATLKLRATTLSTYCYHSLFLGCTALTTAPSLPATTLTTCCYYQMFYRCTSLTEAPVLPATTLVNNCYNLMFYGCTSLKFVNAKFTTTPSSTYTYLWLYNVLANGLFIKNPSATWEVRGVTGIPTTWKVPLTFYSNTNSTLISYYNGGGDTITLYYSTNPTAMSAFYTMSISTSSSTPSPISIASGGAAYIYGNNSSGNEPSSTTLHNYFTVSGNCKLSGDIVSFLGLSASNSDISSITHPFEYLFYNCTGITDASLLKLLPTTIGTDCYSRMFESCSNLVSPPSLPATTLGTGCYNRMFSSCTSLTKCPTISATSMSSEACRYMFANCTKLTSITIPSVSTLANYCYYGMFEGCTSLTSAPSLPATTLADYCYYSMFAGCTSLTTAPSLPATTLDILCYAYMFEGCTKLATAPTLPATTLVRGCYSGMFYNCTTLSSITASFITTPSDTYTRDWVYNVATYGVFTKAPTATWNITGVNGIPVNWTVVTEGEDEDEETT